MKPGRLAVLVAAIGASALADNACFEFDNGNGTVDLPGPCAFTAPDDMMVIVDGLPLGTTIEIDPTLTDFGAVARFPGGTFGPNGEVQQFSAQLVMDICGTGELDFFSRFISMPVTVEIHVGPREEGEPIQEIEAEMFGLSGSLFGDPDFDVLSLLAGFGFGLPSPGHVTLTRVGDPGSDFVVDSFFDVHYVIDFVGEPGSALEDYQGQTLEDVNLRQGKPVGCIWDCGNGNGEVDVVDFLALLADWGPNVGSPCDFNGDGFVDIIDFLQLLANWGPCPGLHPACFPGEGNCFIENGTPACDIPFCCVTVCAADPFCCSGDWDADCVALAGQFCAVQ
jgi:hypothetical protein